MQFQKIRKIKAVSQAWSMPLPWLKKKPNQNTTNITVSTDTSVKSKVETLSQWKHSTQARQNDQYVEL